MAEGIETYSVLGHDILSCNNLALAIKDRYVLFRQKYVKIRDPERLTYLEKKRKESPTRTETHYLDDQFFLDHLHGDYAVAVFAGPNATKFICIDVDMHDPDVVHKVVDTLCEMGIPRDKIYVSMSGGKGYHVDLFVKDKVYNNKAKMIYRQMLEISGLDRHKVEFYPTSGKAVKLPLGVHQTTHRRCWFVDRDTLEPIEDLDYIYETGYIDESLINEIADAYSNRKLEELYAEMKRNRSYTKNPGGTPTPPGFDVIARGTRHIMQRKYAIWRRQHGADYNQLVGDQMTWYDRQNQSLISTTRDGALAEAFSIAKWCVENVRVLDETFAPEKPPSVEFTQMDVAYVLGAPTPAIRKIAFYLLIYCKRFETVKIPYQSIASMVGVSYGTVFTAVDWMCNNDRLVKENITIIKDGFRVNASNKYMLPYNMDIPLISKRYQKKASVKVNDWLSGDRLGRVYATVLNQMCTKAYLKKIMKPKEYEELMNAEDTATDS